jgi:hypothetical protein
MEAARHHNRMSQEKEEERIERTMLVHSILEIPRAFYRRDPSKEPLISLIKFTFDNRENYLMATRGWQSDQPMCRSDC